jgi:hypothetical protein
MSLSREQADQLEYERLKDKLNTRESSTLVFSTVTASASLAILSILIEKRTIPEPYFIIGAIFTLVGILYRELTILSIDRVEYGRLRQLEGVLTGRTLPRPHPTTLFMRRFLVPFYLWIALDAWLITKLSWPVIPVILLLGFVPSLISALLCSLLNDP